MKKRNNFDYSTELKSYCYKDTKISFEDAEKLKHKWAKVDLIENAKNDEDYTPLKLEMLKSLVANLSARELTVKSQALTYHNLKRYINRVFDHYIVTKKDKALTKSKRPYVIPALMDKENPWFYASEGGGVVTYKGVVYTGQENEKKIFKEILISELAVYATKDDHIASLASSTGVALFSEFVNIASQNNEFKNTVSNLFEYLKHLIVTIDRFYNLELKENFKIKVEIRALTGFSRYRIG